MRFFFFRKASQGNLFEQLVPVKGSVREDGTVVKPHYARRQKKHEAPAARRRPRSDDVGVRREQRAAEEPDLFARAPSKRPEKKTAGQLPPHLARMFDENGNPKNHSGAHDKVWEFEDIFPGDAPRGKKPKEQAGEGAESPKRAAAPQPPVPEMKEKVSGDWRHIAAELLGAGLDYTQPFASLEIPDFGVAPGTSKAQRRFINQRVQEMVLQPNLVSRLAMNPENMRLLAQYSGRGGCGDSLNEFYTRPDVAAAMWHVVASLGVREGEVLEPSCGTGVFLATKPKRVTVEGVELDPTAARVARALHSSDSVFNDALEHFAPREARQYAGVIGNVPFGLRGALIRADKPHLKTAEQYFLDTALDKTRESGIVCMIVPTGIMDGQHTRKFRSHLLRKAEFLGALRMPNTAFAASHTRVTTDIVLFRKRPQDVANALSATPDKIAKGLGVWDEEFVSGQYFTGCGAANVLGMMEAGWREKAGMGHDLTVTGSMEGVAARIAAFEPETPLTAAPSMQEIILAAGDDERLARRIRTAALKAPYEQVHLGDTRVVDGVQYVLRGEPPRWHLASEPEAVAPVVRDGEPLAQEIARLMADLEDVDRKGLIAKLDAYVAEYGNPAESRELRIAAARDKTLWRLIGAVQDDGAYSDAITGRETTAHDKSDFDVMAQRLAIERGQFTPDDLAVAWTGGDRDAALDRLFAGAQYAVDADGQHWQTMSDYLSGELWPKLDAAQAALEHEGLNDLYRAKYRTQVEALTDAIAPKSLEDVEVTMASGWVPTDVLQGFLNYRVQQWREENPNSSWGPDPARVTMDGPLYVIAGGMWDSQLLGNYLNRLRVQKDEWSKIEQLNQEFKTWLLGSDFRDDVETAYNRKYRGFVERTYSDAPLNVPGLNPAFEVNAYHYAGLRWALEQGKGIIAEDVGVGKTGESLMLAKLMKAYGRAKKPLFAVPKSVLANWVAECEAWFPGSRVLTIGETYTRGKDGELKGKSDTKAERDRKLHELAQNDYDFVLMSMPAWNDLDLDPKTKGGYIEDDFWVQRADKLDKATDKRKNKIREAYKQQMAQRDFQKRTDVIYLNDLGVDMLVCDEFHCFPAGTKIDGRPIEAIKAGDFVKSLNHATGRIERKRVLDVMSKPVDRLCHVHLSDRPPIACSPEHPFFVRGIGYVQAMHLTDSCIIETERDAESSYDVDLRRMRGEISANAIAAHALAAIGARQSILYAAMLRQGAQRNYDSKTETLGAMRAMQDALPIKQRSTVEKRNRENYAVLLLEVMRIGVALRAAAHTRGDALSGSVGEAQAKITRSQLVTNTRSDRKKPPHSHSEGGASRKEIQGSWRKRAYEYRAPAITSRCLGVGYRGRGADSSSAQPWLSNPLQARYCKSRSNAWYRGRWEQSRSTDTKGAGCQENSIFGGPRVARVEILEPGCDGRFGGLCPDGKIYDLRIEGNANYFAEGLLVHNSFKNLFSARNRYGLQPKFLGGSGQSNRALDTNLKARWIREQNGGKNVFGLTATPTKNSPLEIYSMLSHIAPEEFAERGIRNSEEFIDRYCEFRTEPFLATNGEIDEGLITVGFKNLDEVRALLGKYINRKTAQDVGLELPASERLEHFTDMTPQQEAVYQELRALAAGGQDETGKQAHIFSIMDKMGKAAIDLDLLDDAPRGTPSPKIDECVKTVRASIKDGAQLVFADHVDLHQKIADALIKRGVAPDRIAICNAQTAPTSAKRQNISDKLNSGKLDVAIGNRTMEEGMNMQRRTSDIHHLELPWEPATVQQRNGRGLRQGNTNKGVRIHTYLAKGSFDGYRYQTIGAKRDWQDLLWNGGDRVENLAREGAFGRDELMIMLSADPEAARKKYEGDRTLAAQRAEIEGRQAASQSFRRMQTMRASLAALKNRNSHSAVRLQQNIERIRGRLQSDPNFLAKEELETTGPVLIQPQTGEAWKAGKAFVMPSGQDAALYVSDEPVKMVVTRVDVPDGTVHIRRYGHLSDPVQEVALDKFHAQYETFAYNPGTEVVDAAAEGAGITDVSALHAIPPAQVAKNYTTIQEGLKRAIRNYEPNYNGRWGMMDAEGNPVLIRPYYARHAVDDHDLMLPVPDHREKALGAWLDTARARKFRHAVPYMARRSRNRYAGPTRIEAVYPDPVSITETFNPWSETLEYVFGGKILAEAENRLRQEQTQAMHKAPNFTQAFKAAIPLAKVKGRGIEFDPETVEALRAAAERLGAEQEDMEGIFFELGADKYLRGGDLNVEDWLRYATGTEREAA